MKTRHWLAIATLIAFSGASSGLYAGPRPAAAQKLQQGVSVALPVASSATGMPNADKQGALVITITSEGAAYLGTRSTAERISKEEVERWLAGSADKTVYVKADARTPYQYVIGVLDSLHSLGVKSVVFLTQRIGSRTADAPFPPSGLEVVMGSTEHSGSN